MDNIETRKPIVLLVKKGIILYRYIDRDGKAPGCPGLDAVIVEGATASLVACQIKLKVVALEI